MTILPRPRPRPWLPLINDTRLYLPVRLAVSELGPFDLHFLARLKPYSRSRAFLCIDHGISRFLFLLFTPWQRLSKLVSEALLVLDQRKGSLSFFKRSE